MTKAQKIWDAAYPVKVGQTLKPGTEFVWLDHQDHYGWIKQISILTVEEDELLEIADTHMVRYIRTTERQTDPDDTGEAHLIVRDNGDILMYNREYSSRYGVTLTGQQAHNFAHQILEALDE